MKMSKKNSAIITFFIGLVLVLISMLFKNDGIIYIILNGIGAMLGLIGGFKLMSLTYKK